MQKEKNCSKSLVLNSSLFKKEKKNCKMFIENKVLRIQRVSAHMCLQVKSIPIPQHLAFYLQAKLM